MPFKNVKKALIDQEITITELSGITGYTRGHLSAIINGRMESFRVKKIIALTLDRNFQEIWDNQGNQDDVD